MNDIYPCLLPFPPLFALLTEDRQLLCEFVILMPTSLPSREPPSHSSGCSSSFPYRPETFRSRELPFVDAELEKRLIIVRGEDPELTNRRLC